MSKTLKTKVVSNLLENIGRARDVIATGDLYKIEQKLYLFEKISQEVNRQMAKYIKNASHELDFTYADLEELSTEVYDFIKPYFEKFTYANQFKELCKTIPITFDAFQEFSMQNAHEFRVFTVLQSFYRETAYQGIVIWIWSQTDDKLSIGDLLTKTVRSFI